MNENICCAQCGTQKGYQRGKAKALFNGDWVCSIKCLTEYALEYFGYVKGGN